MVMVFDENGEQMSNYQGKYPDVKERILRDAPKTAQFFRSENLKAEDIRVGRDEWGREEG